MEWATAATALLTVAAALIKWWQSRQPQRDQENRNDEIQQGRTDIATGNHVAVSDRVDRLLTGQSDTARQPDREVTAERISSVHGMADSTGGAGADSGKSGSLPD